MPPKAKIAKNDILEKAFAIVRSEGFQAITARRLSKELNCSTQPIYYSFHSMEDLKKELYQKGTAYFEGYIKSLKKEVPPEEEFLEEGVAYVKGAKLEQKLFHFICMENNYALSGVSDLLKGLQRPQREKDLFLNMWIYVHGIACITANNDVPVNEEEIRTLLIRAYKGFETVI